MLFPEAPVVNRVTQPVIKGTSPVIKVSAVIITHNEERIIRKTLSKLHWCDEIVVVDSYSTDNTIAICKQFGCRIFFRHFDGYGPQKQFAVSKATNEWVFSIDADEVLTDELVQEICSINEKDMIYAGFSIPMNLVFLDKEFVYGNESERYFLRMFNRKRGGFTGDRVHEGIQVNGPVKKMRHIILHYSYSSIYQYMEKQGRYTSYSAEMAYAKGRNKSVLSVLFSLPFYFVKYYVLERNFLNGGKGFYWSALSAYSHFIKYLKIKELNQTAQR